MDLFGPPSFDSLGGRKYCLVIVDDAIYYGSTINLITGYIEKITSIRPFVMPVAINEVFVDVRYAKLVTEDLQNAIKEKDPAARSTLEILSLKIT